MTADELSVICQGLTLKISVITGWQIPENPEYVTILNDQLKKKFVDDYQDLNSDEFEYAMREYGTKIKDWGKGLNLALIDDAICEYLGERHHVSRIEEQKRIKEPDEAKAVNAGAVDWSPEWNKLLESARNGTLNALYCVTPVYDWLFKRGMITFTNPERWAICEECRQAYAYELMVALRTANAPDMRSKYELLIKDGKDWRENKDLWDHVIMASKQETLKRQAYLTVKKEQE